MIEVPEASIITLDTYKRDLHVGEAFDLSENFNGRVGDEQVPLVVKFLERGKTQQFEDGLVPFISGFVGERLNDDNVVNADTGVGVSYTGSREDIIGMGIVKMNLPGTMFPQEGWFYGFLGLETPDHSKRVSTFNVWFHVYNGNPDMFVNKEPFRTELQKLIDSFTTDIANAKNDALAVIAEYKQKLQGVSDDATWMMSQLDIIEAKIKSNDIATNSQLKQAVADLSANLINEISKRPTNQDVVEMLERGFANFDGGNPHTVADLATLKSQYPKGTSGVWVTQDTGHMYFWNAISSEWVDGGAYNAVEIKDGSITAEKLAENAQTPIFVPSGDGIPNYDSASHLFDFRCVTDQAFFMINNKPVQVPIGTSVHNDIDAQGFSSSKLIYNFDTKEFSFIGWTNPLASNQAMLGGLRKSKMGWLWSGSTNITIDGKQVDQYNVAPNVSFSVSGPNVPNFDSKTRIFDFNSNQPTTATILIGERVIPIPEGTVAQPTTAAMKNNTLRIVYNVQDNTAKVISWNDPVPPYCVMIAPILMNYRNHPIIGGDFPYTIDGSQTETQNYNVEFAPSSDGAPIFNKDDYSLDLNCYTDSAYIVYDGNSYQVPKNTVIPYENDKYTSVRFLFKPSTMEFKSVAWNTPISVGWVQIAAIRFTKNNEALVTASFPITVKGSSFKPSATDNPLNAKIKGINHRGFNTVAPEESRSAYLLSKQNGYHHWEGDINWTKDNVPMMIHDLAINRTARNLDGTELSSTINLTDLNYADLAKYDFGIAKGARFKGEPLLTFEDLVKLARYNDAFLHIEFKYAFTQEQVQTLHNIVVKYNMLDRIGWQAFGWDWLKPMMALEPNGQYELLGGDVNDDYFTKMAALKTNTNTIIASQNAALSVDDIQKIADKGYPIYLWTVDDGATVRKFRDIGMVEGIMTNGAINVADELTK